VALKAMRLPSGDQEKPVTLNVSPEVSASGLGSFLTSAGISAGTVTRHR
jgi:hypothetical protein